MVVALVCISVVLTYLPVVSHTAVITPLVVKYFNYINHIPLWKSSSVFNCFYTSIAVVLSYVSFYIVYCVSGCGLQTSNKQTIDWLIFASANTGLHPKLADDQFSCLCTAHPCVSNIQTHRPRYVQHLYQQATSMHGMQTMQRKN